MLSAILILALQPLSAQPPAELPPPEETVEAIDAPLVDSLCGITERPIRLAEMPWDSSIFHNALVSFILREGYGCLVETTTGSNIALLEKLANGEIDIMLEVWKDNLKNNWEKFEKNGRVKIIGTNYSDAEQGWYVPRYLVEGDEEKGLTARAPELKGVEDLVQYKALFNDPVMPEKGRFYNCQQGWGCEVINTRKLQGYGLAEHFNNFRPASQTALAGAISRHYEQGEPFLAYYWGPTWVLGKFDLVKLEEPVYDELIWQNMLATEEPTQAVAYPQHQVDIAVSAKFLTAAPKINDFLSVYQTDNQSISDALAYQRDVIDRTPTDAAVEFLRNAPERWQLWLPPDIARKLERAIAIGDDEPPAPTETPPAATPDQNMQE